MEFKNISTEDDFRANKIRMEVTWEKDDIDRFSEFFGRPMTEVVGLIDDSGDAVGAVVSSPELASAEASTDVDPGNKVLKAVVETCGGRVTFSNELIRNPAGHIDLVFEGDHTTVTVRRGASPDHPPQIRTRAHAMVDHQGDPCTHGPGVMNCGHPDCVGWWDYQNGRFN